MLCIRVIPLVLYDGVQAVKSVRFGRPLRNVGHVVSVARVYQRRNADEIVFLDVAARARDQGPDLAVVESFARELFCPFTVGGGVRSTNEARALLAVGADRVAIGLEHAPNVVSDIARSFGAQAVTVVVDARTVHDAIDGAHRAADMGAGEVVVQAIDRDGTMTGPDLDMISEVTHAVDVPVVYAGGVGSPTDAVEAIRAGADAVAVAAMFHFTGWTLADVKRAMRADGIPVRP
jgi:cyclase